MEQSRAGYRSLGRVAMTLVVNRGYSGMLTQQKREGAVTLEDQPGKALTAGLLLSTAGDLKTAQGVPPKR